MRVIFILLGVALLAAGIWVVMGDASYEATDTLFKIGSAEVDTKHDKEIPQWVGIAGIAIGAVLAAGGFFGRK